MNVLAARNKVLSANRRRPGPLSMIVPAVMAATAPPLNLPAQAVTVVSYGLYLNGRRRGMRRFGSLSAESSGFDVTNGVDYPAGVLRTGC